jgi:hypothetical protein
MLRACSRFIGVGCSPSWSNSSLGAAKCNEDGTTPRPLGKEQLKEIEDRAVQAIEGKGRCWWNPEKNEGKKRGRFGIQIVE